MNKTTKIIFLVALLLAVSACFVGYLWYLSHPTPTPWGEIILPTPTEKPTTTEPVVSKDFPPGTLITEANFCGDIVKAEKVEIMGVDIVKRIAEIQTEDYISIHKKNNLPPPEHCVLSPFGLNTKIGVKIETGVANEEIPSKDLIEITFYDLSNEENGVLYIVDKNAGNIYDLGPYGSEIFGTLR